MYSSVNFACLLQSALQVRPNPPPPLPFSPTHPPTHPPAPAPHLAARLPLLFLLYRPAGHLGLPVHHLLSRRSHLPPHPFPGRLPLPLHRTKRRRHLFRPRAPWPQIPPSPNQVRLSTHPPTHPSPIQNTQPTHSSPLQSNPNNPSTHPPTPSSLYGLEESMTANALLGAKAPSLLRRRRSSTPTVPPPGSTTHPPPRPQQQQQQHYWRPQILVYLHASEVCKRINHPPTLPRR